MAYTINYDKVSPRNNTAADKRRISSKAITALLCTAVILIVWMITPVRVAVLDFLLPGDGQVTRRAAGEFLNDLKQGQPIKEAFTDFCIEIVENA